MTGCIRDGAGKSRQLPPLTSWELRRTDGDPCGAFTVRFPADETTAALCRSAVSFTASEDGETVFLGVVDECLLTLDGGGRMAELSGRDLGARLLDNQCRAAEFQSAQLEDILGRYVRPFGVTRIRADALPAVPNFSVQTGDSCWQALSGFCRHAADVRPRFAADGTLLLERAPSGKKRTLTMACAPTALRLRSLRYGVISEQTVLDFTKKSIETVQNPAFDGLCKKVAARSGKTLKAAWRTAAQRIADSGRARTVLELTAPGAFLAEPWDRAAVRFEALGIAGDFVVTEAATALNGSGLFTTLTMREEG